MYTIDKDKLYKAEITEPIATNSSDIKLAITWDEVYLQRRDYLSNLLKNISSFPIEKVGDN